MVELRFYPWLLFSNIAQVGLRDVLGFCQGGCTFLADLPPLPPDLDQDSDPHQDFELDLDPALDPHQNNADPKPWAQLSKDCCLIYNYV